MRAEKLRASLEKYKSAISDYRESSDKYWKVIARKDRQGTTSKVARDLAKTSSVAGLAQSKLAAVRIELEKLKVHTNESVPKTLSGHEAEKVLARYDRIKEHAAMRSSGTNSPNLKSAGGGSDEYNRDEQGRFAPK